MTRIIATFPDRRQVGQAVDALNRAGITRKDLIISDAGVDEHLNPAGESYVKSEMEDLGSTGSFAKVNDVSLEGQNTILVSVEIPAERVTSISDILKRTGAVNIRSD